MSTNRAGMQFLIILNSTVGHVKLLLENVTEKATEERLTRGGVGRGGFSHPANCSAREKLAVVVPYRARAQQLLVLMANLHPMLQRQQRDYAIFVVEQEGNTSFNRAALMNVGFLEALQADDNFSCFVFHDVDLLPENDRNVYECAPQPRHMSHAVNTLNYRSLSMIFQFSLETEAYFLTED
jgi:N-terminal region of glycosyl transferase group 7